MVPPWHNKSHGSFALKGQLKSIQLLQADIDHCYEKMDVWELFALQFVHERTIRAKNLNSLREINHGAIHFIWIWMPYGQPTWQSHH